MKNSIHLVVCILLAAIFFSFYSFAVLWIIAGGVLIDIDHYLWYVSKFKKYNMRKCYTYCAEGTIKDNWKYVTGALFIFHNIEFLILAAILSIYFKSALMFTIGLLSHYVLDFIWHVTFVKKITHSLSFTEWMVRNLQNTKL